MNIIPKTGFSKVHIFSALFVIMNTITGVGILLGLIPFSVFSQFHFISGLLIFITPAVVLLFIKNQKQVMTSIKTLGFVNQFDIERKKYLRIISKILINIFGLLLILMLTTGVLMKLKVYGIGTMNTLFYTIHTIIGSRIIPALLILHIITILISTRPQKKMQHK